MAHTIVGHFDTWEHAHHAVEDIVDQAAQGAQSQAVAAQGAQSQAVATQAGHATDLSVGSIVGGLFGGVMGGFVAVGAEMLPGIGPMVMASPIGQAVGGLSSGMLLGVVVGGLLGGFLGARAWGTIAAPDPIAHVADDGQGGTMIIVNTDALPDEQVTAILAHDGATDIQVQ